METRASAFLLGAAIGLTASISCTRPTGEPSAAVDVTAAISDATQLVEEGDHAGAIELLEPALAAAPNNRQVLFQLLRSHRAVGAYEESLALSARAAELPGVRGAALQETLFTQLTAKDLDAAKLTYEEWCDAPLTDLSGLHLNPLIADLAEDSRFESLFPRNFDDAFVEGERVVRDWHGEGRGHEFGWEARNAGDLDGDGVNDAVVSAPGNQPGGDSTGKVYTYSGRTGELLWSVSGEGGDQLGMGIEAAGDVNGNGTPDVIAGAPGAGRAYVYEGSDGHLLWTFPAAEDDGASFASAVAGAGDVDGDGYGDILVGSPSSGGGAGKAYLYSGADGRTLLEIEGEAGDGAGSVVAGWTGDGKSFLVVGAPGAGEGGRGVVRVYTDLSGEPAFTIEAAETGAQLGAMFASVVGDINGDGTQDIYASDWNDRALGPATGRIYVHSGADGSRLLTLGGEAPGDGFGIGPARAGDVNGDGYDDLVIGAWQHGSAAHSGGKIYVYSGKDAALLLTFTGKIPGATLGFDADGMGDVNGDGRADFLVTSAWSLVNGPRSGRTMIVSAGSAPFL